MPYIPPKNDVEYSMHRLDSILSRRRLIFNPYTVSDSRLMEIVRSMTWGDDYDITEMTVMKFTRLRPIKDYREFDGIFMTVGPSSYERFISCAIAKCGITANDTVSRERLYIGKRKIYNATDLRDLLGKEVFVSHVIKGVDFFGNFQMAYHMHRLYGKTGKDAAIIRQAMCAAKIEMLERLLKYPQSPDYLSCRKDLFSYEPRICRAIAIISDYPNTPVPPDDQSTNNG